MAITKHCSHCKTEKSLFEFGANKRFDDGLQPRCRVCSNAMELARYMANPEKFRVLKYEAYHKDIEKSRAELRARRKASPEKFKRYNAECYAKNREGRKERMREYSKSHSAEAVARATQWKKNHPWVVAADCMRRYATKTHATPSWSNSLEIREIYRRAAELRRIGIDVQVDHIIPLRSKLVSGLHVPANLRIIPTKENQIKGNRIILGDTHGY